MSIEVSRPSKLRRTRVPGEKTERDESTGQAPFFNAHEEERGWKRQRCKREDERQDIEIETTRVPDSSV